MSSKAVEIVKQFSGQERTISIPRPFIEMTGDYVCAAVLSQLLYWWGKMGREFYKSDEELSQELCITPYQLRRARKALEEFGVVHKRKGVPARMHYQIDEKTLNNQLCSFLTTVPKETRETSYEETSQQVSREPSQLIQKITSIDDTKELKDMSPKGDDGRFDFYQNEWNQGCGNLTKCYVISKDAERLIRQLEKRHGVEEAHTLFVDGISAVAEDAYWLGERAGKVGKAVTRNAKPYGIVNLLRNVEDKANAARDKERTNTTAHINQADIPAVGTIVRSERYSWTGPISHVWEDGRIELGGGAIVPYTQVEIIGCPN